ncbi:MAG: hypothetical protein A2077_01320 [Nitrospirae bacterium GWC2_46_6]|nr:MAG: hypothetical protein A2077_01320 [Nitrospirae bacterium GWC2_46_6]OGW23173.1 MAG: hypothetical protein A2X55_09375 [Nitrospirae bacterium GWB2_47_37]HAK87723.1 hypothetical protein [Nitrospiraceae bacterium]
MKDIRKYSKAKGHGTVPVTHNAKQGDCPRFTGKAVESGLSPWRNDGFAFIAALLALLLITAIGMLVFTASTSDIRTSTRITGEKKAFSAAETGLYKMIQNFDPDNLSGSATSGSASDATTWPQVDSATDPDSRYRINTPAAPTSGASYLPLAGYAIGGGQQWGQSRYDVDITGTNTRYSSRVEIGVGFGYGPVEISTTYK